MYIILWHNQYVCGEPQFNSTPELTDDLAEALQWKTKSEAQTWLDMFYNEPKGKTFSIIGNENIVIKEVPECT